MTIVGTDGFVLLGVVCYPACPMQYSYTTLGPLVVVCDSMQDAFVS
jgi:hypothetical protein